MAAAVQVPIEDLHVVPLQDMVQAAFDGTIGIMSEHLSFLQLTTRLVTDRVMTRVAEFAGDQADIEGFEDEFGDFQVRHARSLPLMVPYSAQGSASYYFAEYFFVAKEGLESDFEGIHVVQLEDIVPTVVPAVVAVRAIDAVAVAERPAVPAIHRRFVVWPWSQEWSVQYGIPYYWNNETGVAVWENPCVN